MSETPAAPAAGEARGEGDGSALAELARGSGRELLHSAQQRRVRLLELGWLGPRAGPAGAGIPDYLERVHDRVLAERVRQMAEALNKVEDLRRAQPEEESVVEAPQVPSAAPLTYMTPSLLHKGPSAPSPGLPSRAAASSRDALTEERWCIAPGPRNPAVPALVLPAVGSPGPGAGGDAAKPPLPAVQTERRAESDGGGHHTTGVPRPRTTPLRDRHEAGGAVSLAGSGPMSAREPRRGARARAPAAGPGADGKDGAAAWSDAALPWWRKRPAWRNPASGSTDLDKALTLVRPHGGGGGGGGGGGSGRRRRALDGSPGSAEASPAAPDSAGGSGFAVSEGLPQAGGTRRPVPPPASAPKRAASTVHRSRSRGLSRLQASPLSGPVRPPVAPQRPTSQPHGGAAGGGAGGPRGKRWMVDEHGVPQPPWRPHLVPGGPEFDPAFTRTFILSALDADASPALAGVGPYSRSGWDAMCRKRRRGMRASQAGVGVGSGEAKEGDSEEGKEGAWEEEVAEEEMVVQEVGDEATAGEEFERHLPPTPSLPPSLRLLLRPSPPRCPRSFLPGPPEREREPVEVEEAEAEGGEAEEEEEEELLLEESAEDEVGAREAAECEAMGRADAEARALLAAEGGDPLLGGDAEQSATSIQRMYRGSQVRRGNRQRRTAAKRIQHAFRNWRLMKQQRDLKQLVEAATRLQSIFRGANTRTVVRCKVLNSAGVMMAMPGTVQGATGWYREEDNVYYFVITETGDEYEPMQWWPMVGPLARDSWYRLRQFMRTSHVLVAIPPTVQGAAGMYALPSMEVVRAEPKPNGGWSITAFLSSHSASRSMSHEGKPW